jgi:Cu2+-containing amine oxidase
MAYVSGSTPSAPVTSVKLFISYALNHVTTATVKDVFDSVFNNEVTQIEELTRTDRDTGKPFKLFWITLEPARHSPVWRFVDEIEKYDKASIIYETRKGKDFYWQVRLNKEKTPVKTAPRIMAREETTSKKATDKERADVIAFTKTPAFSKLVDSVVLEGVIEPKLEAGEIKEGNSAQRRKAQRAKLQESDSAKRQRLEEQEAALADWESR